MDANNNQHYSEGSMTPLESVSNLFTSRKFEECLKYVGYLQKEDLIRPNQAKIYVASCWTHLGVNQDEALKCFTEVIRTEPDNAFAHFELGIYLYLQGKLVEAILEFQLAAHCHPAYLECSSTYIEYLTGLLKLFGNSDKLFASGEYTKSSNLLTTAIATCESNETIAKIASAKVDVILMDIVKKVEDKVLMSSDKDEEVDEVGELNDKEVTDTYEHIEQLINENQFEKAEELFQPDETLATAYEWYLKGLLKYKFGKLKSAILCFNKSLDIEPDLVKAQEVKEKAVKIVDMMDLATREMKCGNFLKSVMILTETMKIDEKNFRILQGIYFQMASCKFNAGYENEAFNDFLQFEAIQKITGLVKVL